MRTRRKICLRFSFVTAAVTIAATLSVYAAPSTMPDGQTFDAEYYVASNPDVSTLLGTEEAVLYQHYVTYGKSEGRKPYAEESGTDIYHDRSSVSEQTLADAAITHNYYKNISAEDAAAADNVAKQIADYILAEPKFDTDLRKVRAAAAIVSNYSRECTYGNDEAKWYRSPYGVFIGGVYTCAGSTRALGRVLDYMGYSWEHANENQYAHQWCILTMDGQIGYADGMGGDVDYGTHFMAKP